MWYLMKQQSNNLSKDLYHREPYLLLDEAKVINSEKIVATKFLAEDDFWFQGHFPNAPILPGALMQEMTTQVAGILIAREHNPDPNYNTNKFDPESPALGVLVRIKDAKFKGFARPNDHLEITVNLIETITNFMEFKASIKKITSNGNQEVIMKNNFILTNIPSRQLLS